jgi:hypothetical protein
VTGRDRLRTFSGTFEEVESTAGEVLWAAMEARHPVTVGFWEVRKDDRRRPMSTIDPETGLRVPLFVHAVRTFELYEVAANEDNGQLVFRGMDRCPADRSDPTDVKWGRPGIRRVVAGRVTDVTVHRRQSYRYPNQHFISRVRQHAKAQHDHRWAHVATLTDDAIWHMIEEADSTEDAINRAGTYAARM